MSVRRMYHHQPGDASRAGSYDRAGPGTATEAQSGRRDESSPVLRLRGDRRRLGRLRARVAADRRPVGKRRAARGGRARPQRADPLPGGLRRDPEGQAPIELGVPDRCAAGAERPARLPAARPHARRIEFDQRDDLHPRPPRRLRRLGRRGQPGLVLRRGAAVLQALGEQRASGRRPARPRRPAQHDGPAQPEPVLGALRPGLRPGRIPRQPGLQRRAAGRRRHVPGQPARRRALLGGPCLPDPGARAAEPERLHASARHAHPDPGPARDRGRVRRGRQRARDRRAARGVAVRRGVPVAAAAAAVGDRAGGATAAPRHRGRPRAGRRRPSAARPRRRRPGGRHAAGQGPVRAVAARRLERAARDRAVAARAAGAADDQFRRSRRLPAQRPRPAPARPAAALRDRQAHRPRPQDGVGPRLLVPRLPAAARQPRQRRTGERRPDGRTVDRPQLPRRRARPRTPGARGCAGAPHPRAARARGAGRARAAGAGRRAQRRRSRPLRPRPRRHDRPPGGQLPHGPARHRRRRCAAAGARDAGAARRRRLGDAARCRGQHQRAGDHDRREGGRHDPRGRALTDRPDHRGPGVAVAGVCPVASGAIGSLDGLGTSARRIAALAWPVFVGQVAVLGFATVDTVLVARQSSADLAALAVGSAAYITIFIGLMGMVLAIGPIVGQLYGARRLDEAGHQFWQATWIALALAIVASALLAFPAPFIALSRPPPAMAAKVRDYLQSLAFAVPASLVFTVFRGFNIAVSRPKAVMVLQLGGLALKVPLSAALVQGVPALGLDRLGVQGCGWSTAIAMWLQAAVALVLLRLDPFYARFHFGRRGGRRPHAASLRALLHLGVPMGMSMMVEVTGFSFMAIFISRLGETAVAGHQIAVNLVSLLFMMPLALANGTSTLVAQAIGAGALGDARRLGWHGLQLALALALALGASVYFGRAQVVGLYTGDAAIAAAALPLLAWVALFHAADATQTVSALVLRAWRIATLPTVIYVVSLWGVGLGGGWVLAFDPWQALPRAVHGARGYWIAATAGLAVAALALSALLAMVLQRQRRRG